MSKQPPAPPPAPPPIPFAPPDGDTLAARIGPALPPARPAVAGDVVDDRYHLICELGQGGMGVVHLAEDQRLQRRVAIKFLRAQATEADVTRFRREAQLLAALSHPNVVRVYDLGSYQGRPYFVMEYLDGITLAEALANAGGDGLPVDVAIGFGRQLCEALDAVHKQGIIHRDIKPGNVIICAGTNAVLMDFGLARLDATSMDRAQLSGTPQYLAPEDISGRSLTGEEARRSDIYSLGITLYELIAGRPPFHDEDTVKVLHHQLHDPPQPLCDIRPDVPTAFERVIMRALEKDPARRQVSCTELVTELSQARTEVVSRRAAAAAPAPVPAHKPPSRPESISSVVPGDSISLPSEMVSSPTFAAISGGGLGRSPGSSPDYHDDVEVTRRDPFGFEPVAAAGPRSIALVLDPGPGRDRLVEGLRAALGEDCAIKPLPDGTGPVHGALAKLAPSCAIIDLDLIEESPFELCARLKSSAATAKIAVIVIGEDVGAAQEELFARMGVSSLLRKPFDPARLGTMVVEATRSR